MKALLTAFLVIFILSNAHASTKGRIMTDGKVSMYKNGKVVNSFTNQGPVDENSLISCDGSCLVKIKGISLIVTDQSRFAIKDFDNSTSLYVEEGKIHFAVSDVSKQFSFYTPDGYFVKTEGFITPASTDNSVKGFMQVTDTGTKIGMDQGTMIIRTDKGTESVEAGQAIVLAMAEVPPDVPKNRKAGAAPCEFFAWECKTTAQKVAIGGGAAAGAGLGVLLYLDAALDDDQIVNIFERIPASPNE
ncbi:MAG TPA: hypothetical protein ENO11_06020 [Desulfobacteraceae bacterium]|nr:hypothetical protein [Desulfobacteraceae bacterium]